MACVCDICHKEFFDENVLNQHLLSHTREKPHVCEVCQKAFFQQGHLKRHLLTHTGEKPYVCDVCQKAFSQRSSLNTHLLIHTAKKSFECVICHAGFFQQDKLLIGVKESKILSDVRQQTNVDEGEERHHIITRKDITNIKMAIGISEVSSDEIGLKLWVQKMCEEGNQILQFKGQNTEHPHLKYQDFFLSFMMPIQLQMLEDFSGDQFCVDSTHGTNAYNFELVTLMVIDEFEEGFPVAFYLASTVNFETMSFFSQNIKSVVPITIKTKVFMSDDAPFFYQESVFCPVESHPLCMACRQGMANRHVDRASNEHNT